MLQHDFYLPGARAISPRLVMRCQNALSMNRRRGPNDQTGAGNEPKASISRSWRGAVMERRPRSEKAPRPTTRSALMDRASFPPHRPDGVSERRTRLLSSVLYAYQLVR